MNKTLQNSIVKIFKKYPPLQNKIFKYGTAGFRTKAELLDFVILSAGIIAGLRSLNQKKITGVMITASHNEVEDNGCKIAEVNGEMLTPSWEKYVQKLANMKTVDEFISFMENILKETNTVIPDDGDSSLDGLVYIGRDTRPSSLRLSNILIEGVKLVNCKGKNFGVLTTPQVHFLVKHDNENGKRSQNENVYYETLSKAYREIVSNQKNFKKIKIRVDCAYGVGGPITRKLEKYLKDEIEFDIFNDPSKDQKLADKYLNYKCGAEHVQKRQEFPINFKKQDKQTESVCVASYDGDADRLVFSFGNGDKSSFNLLDGDKILTLATIVLFKNLEKIGILNKISFGIIQTAYANGASSNYLRKLAGKQNVFVVPTGVKHLHHKAKNFDAGVYFEANGHGTVLFSNKFFSLLKEVLPTFKNGSEEKKSCQLLSNFGKLINQAVGDAISDLLMVLAMLACLDYSTKDWIELYKDLPSCQSKLKVKDRSVIKTVWNETKVLKPEGFQEKIDKAVSKYKGARAFIRPSGTEDVVRIYTESQTPEDSASLMNDIKQLIKNDKQNF